MAAILPGTSIREFQSFINDIYGASNGRNYDTSAMLTNVQRFTMRALKGIRKGDNEKVKNNLMISCSWFMSFLNRLHIDLQDELWKRFPNSCSYCNSCPCSCKKNKPLERGQISNGNSNRPKTMRQFQEMFCLIYPPISRTIEQAGVHLAEEMGELSESALNYYGRHSQKDFSNISEEAADYFSCLIGVFNSLGMDLAKELSLVFSENCHVCKKSPCECTYDFVAAYES
jgi:NTP pyrophosphatase (non-canonical NTP hydrolase)